MSYMQFTPYVSQTERRAQAQKKVKELKKKSKIICPVEVEGRKIGKTFWAISWIQHLEKYFTFSNRLPRGRTYLRNGSVVHLEIKNNNIKAIVSGSSLYNVNLHVSSLAAKSWDQIKQQCGTKIGSILDLLQGKFDANVMETICHPQKGLFPLSSEISFECSCPDSVVCCKHVAAVLYGIAVRFDEDPKLFFMLRGVDPLELVSSVASIAKPQQKSSAAENKKLGALFGIEIDHSQDGDEKNKTSFFSENI